MSEAFYFGESSSKLFGIYEPAKSSFCDKAVLICYPIGHEYLKAFRCFKLLSKQLSASDAHVMRFDYSGTGDSYLETNEASISGWIKDVELAIEELKAISGIKQVTLIGLRMGAALAGRALANRSDILSLICWDPVYDGKHYLQQLKDSHHKMLNDHDRFLTVRDPAICSKNELLGYQYSDTFINELMQIGAETFSALNAQKCRFVFSSESMKKQFEAELVDTKFPSQSFHSFSYDMEWCDFEQLENTFLPQDIIQYLVSEITL